MNKEQRFMHFWRRRWILALVIWGLLSPFMALALGIWIPLANQAPASISEIYLLSDGSVLALNPNNGAAKAYRLVPDIHGSYINGTWSQLASMHDGRSAFATQILKDGSLLIVGAEHGGGQYSAETYDPLMNVWTFCPSTGAAYSDACSEILPNGNVLVSPVGPTNGGGTLIYNPALNNWVAGPNLYRGYDEAEGCWVKLPDNSILTVDFGSTNSERYIPSLNKWNNDANIPVNLWQGGAEIGAGLLLPNGKVFWLGDTNTALYTPSGTTNMGVWQAGPMIPDSQSAAVAPACMMPNGKALCMLHPVTTYGPPGSFYEYDPTANAFTQAALPGGNSNLYPNDAGMTVLPDGTILVSFNNNSGTYVYQPDGSQLAAGKPTVISITNIAYRTYHLTGQLLNGLNEGPNYGGGNQENSCNYPLVRMTNSATGNVYYARTYNWSSNGVMTGTNVVSTEFMVPENLPAGNYSLVVVADGISSAPVSFTFNPDPLSITLLTGFAGSGPVGGPFSPSAQAYFLNNTGTSLLNWYLINTSAWLNVPATGGTLVAGGQSIVIVSLSSTATNLPAGIYTASIWFTNLNTGAAQSVPFRLEVTPLIQNGGFETGSFAAWNLSGNFGNAPYSPVSPFNYLIAHSGNFAAFLGRNNSFGYISQAIATVPGQSYLLSLFVNSPSSIGSTNEFAVSWNGIILFDQQDFTTTGWTQLQFVVWATSDSTELEFSYQNTTNYFWLDDISLSNLPPTLSIASQPASQVIPVGGNANFYVMASGPPPFSYHWQKNGIQLHDGGDILGSATASLSVSNAIAMDGGNYSVVVSSGGSLSVTSLVATLTVVGTVTNCAMAAPVGLISWWTGNVTANDLVGTNNGTLQNGVTYVPGEVAYAFNLDGISQYVNVPDAASMEITGPITVVGWIKTKTSNVQQSVIEKYGTPVGGGYALRETSNNNVKFFTLDNGLTGDSVSGTTSLAPNTWYHIAGLWNGSNIQVYVNGALDGTANSTRNPKAGSTPLRIGARGDDTATPFAGQIDEAAIFNRALSASEIQAIYQAGTNGMCAPTPLMFTGSPSYNKTNGVVLNASLRSSQSYHIQANTNLVSTNWVTLTNFIAGTAPIFHYTNKPPTNTLQQFYRIVSP